MVGAEMEGEEEARAERRREKGGWLESAGAEGWHRGRDPASSAPVPPSEGKTWSSTLLAEGRKWGSCWEPSPAPSPSQERLVHGCHHLSTAPLALCGLAPCPGVTAAGTRCNHSYFPSSEREEMLLFFPAKVNKGMGSQSSLKL